MSEHNEPINHSNDLNKLKINWPPPEILQKMDSIQNTIDASQLRRFNEIDSEITKSMQPFTKALTASKAFSLNLLTTAPELNLSYFNVLNDVAQSILSSLQPQLFEAVKTAAALIPTIDFSTISSQYRQLYASQQYLKLLKLTQWPLYLLDRESLLDDIGNLKLSMDEQMLREEMAECAMKNLGSDWLKETYNRWASMEQVEADKKELLFDTLRRHENGDYSGCVSILMCLFEGFIESYAVDLLRSADIDPELFDWAAEKHSLRSLCPKPNKHRNLNAKDHIIVFWLQTDRGWYIWREASSYLIDVILTNHFDEQTAAHNPLRNKICHGEQTAYNTWEHSAKAILATDIVLRLGAAASAAVEASDE